MWELAIFLSVSLIIIVGIIVYGNYSMASLKNQPETDTCNMCKQNGHPCRHQKRKHNMCIRCHKPKAICGCM